MPADYAALEAARLARDPRDLTKAAYTINESQASVVRYQRSDYAVAKVFDDGRPNVIVAGGTGWSSFEAEARAGKLRDGMSDDEVARALQEGWSYAAVTVRGTARVRKAFVPRAETADERKARSKKALARRWPK